MQVVKNCETFTGKNR